MFIDSSAAGGSRARVEEVASGRARPGPAPRRRTGGADAAAARGRAIRGRPRRLRRRGARRLARCRRPTTHRELPAVHAAIRHFNGNGMPFCLAQQQQRHAQSGRFGRRHGADRPPQRCDKTGACTPARAACFFAAPSRAPENRGKNFAAEARVCRSFSAAFRVPVSPSTVCSVCRGLLRTIVAPARPKLLAHDHCDRDSAAGRQGPRSPLPTVMESAVAGPPRANSAADLALDSTGARLLPFLLFLQ